MPSCHLGDVGIKGWHDPIQRLNHRDFTAESRINIGKFKADITTADNCNPTRQPFQVHGFITGKNRASIGFNPRGHKWIRACGKDHIPGSEQPIHSTFLSQANSLASLQSSMATQDRDTSPLQRFGEVATNRGHQLVGMVSNLLAFKTHRCSMDPETR